MSYFVMPILLYVCACLCLLAWFSCADACLPACFPFAHARLFSLFDTRLFVVLMLASIFCVKVLPMIAWYSCSSDAGASLFFLC